MIEDNFRYLVKGDDAVVISGALAILWGSVSPLNTKENYGKLRLLEEIALTRPDFVKEGFVYSELNGKDPIFKKYPRLLLLLD